MARATAAASLHSTAPPEPRCGHGSSTANATRRHRRASAVRYVSRTGQQLSVRSITKLVTKVMAAAGVEETAHGLRHTLATRLVRQHGRDLALVADVLGHADVKTTRRYARSELEDRRAALEALDR
jgi:site-specific recombinase XerD